MGFDEHSSIHSSEENQNLVEESFLSELKELYNTDLSLNIGNNHQDTQDQNQSINLFKFSKPIGDVFSTLFKKNEDRVLVQYYDKIYSVI